MPAKCYGANGIFYGLYPYGFFCNLLLGLMHSLSGHTSVLLKPFVIFSMELMDVSYLRFDTFFANIICLVIVKKKIHIRGYMLYFCGSR